MTENKQYVRFIDNYEDVYIKTPIGRKIEIGWEDDISVDSIDKVVNLLNEQDEQVKKLSEENIMLKEANLILRDNNDSLRRDNEELKKEIKYLQSELHNATVNVRKKTLNEVKVTWKLKNWRDGND